MPLFPWACYFGIWQYLVYDAVKYGVDEDDDKCDRLRSNSILLTHDWVCRGSTKQIPVQIVLLYYLPHQSSYVPGWVCTKSQGCPNPLCRWQPELCAKERLVLLGLVNFLRTYILLALTEVMINHTWSFAAIFKILTQSFQFLFNWLIDWGIPLWAMSYDWEHFRKQRAIQRAP